MKQITEYLLSKRNTKIVQNDFFSMFKEIYKDSDDTIERMSKEINKHIAEYKFNEYRIISNYPDINKIIDEETGLYPSNFSKYRVIVEDMFEDLYGRTYLNLISIDGENADYTLYFDKTCIFITNDDISLLFDTIEKGEDFNPYIDTYYVDGGDAVELSDEKLGLDFDREDDLIWDEWNKMCDEASDDFEQKTGIQLLIGGRGGRHVCARGSYDLIHNLNKYINLVKEYQKNLVSDINDWIKDNYEE